jgi:cyclic-di-GMP-binding protein
VPSFDTVSKVDWAELENALNQAEREVAQRFDFKGTDTEIERTDKRIVFHSMTLERAKAAFEVFEQKLIRRKVSLKHIEKKDPEKGPKGSFKIPIDVKEGIETDKAREIVKLIKESKLKVQASITEQAVRISGKKKDDLQDAIRLLRSKAEDLSLDLQFVNFRD